MKKIFVLLLSLGLLGLLTGPVVAQQGIFGTLGSSNINNDIDVNVTNSNGAQTGDANATGNSSITGIGNFSAAIALGGIAGNNTTNTVINSGEAIAVSGDATALQGASNTVGVVSSNNAGVGSIIVGP